MRNRFHFTLIAFFVCLLLFDSFALKCEAVREGSDNAYMMIRGYESKEQFGKAALWGETAVRCSDVISLPLARITLEYCQRSGNRELGERVRREVAGIKVQRYEYLRRTELNWEKAKEGKKELNAERTKIDRFIAEWVPHYPDRFYQFGTYRNVFRKRIGALKERRKFGDALLLEADASDMCCRQYEDVTVKYFQDKAEYAEKVGDKSLLHQSRRQAEAYQKVRDKHLKRSAMLRALAKQNPHLWPVEADKKDFNVPQSKHKLTTDKAIKLARADKRIQQILKKREDVREVAWFQGFCWTVSYYTPGWRNLGVAYVDDETGEVTDVLFSPGNLKEHEFDNGEKDRSQKLRLAPQKVIKIAKNHPKVKSYFKERPEAKANAAYNWRYKCWIVEVVLNNREVGIVSVSDKTEKVLEVTVGHRDPQD